MITSSAVVYEHDDALNETLLPKDETDTPIEMNLSTSKALTAVGGAVVAVLSQVLWHRLLWDDSNVPNTTLGILLFSLCWSCWTYGTLFAGLMSILKLASHSDECRLFQMEVYYVVSSLLTISCVCIFDESAVFVVTTMQACVLSILALMAMQSTSSLLTRSSLVVAGTLGLIFGVCSQFVLSLIFWMDTDMKEPIVFSLAWSTSTVILTFLGCFSLRSIVEKYLRSLEDADKDLETEEATSVDGSGYEARPDDTFMIV